MNNIPRTAKPQTGMVGVSVADHVTVMVKLCVAGLPTPLLALIVPVKVPGFDGAPERTPVELRVKPGGRLPEATVNVAAG